MTNITRRDFILASTTALAGSAIPPVFASESSKYVRYNVTTPEGQEMLKSYIKGIKVMLSLPADHPNNWFRNAFIHMMDCPHGNWWFYVWHRAYIGYFEETIRKFSGNDNFTLPFWDWTETPEIPSTMFDSVLSPTAKEYLPYTENLAVFTDFIKPELSNYWKTLTPSQRKQQAERGYNTFEDLWNSVVGINDGQGIAGDMAYVNTLGARFLSKGNPYLDPKTRFDVSPLVVGAGIVLPTTFYEENNYMSFASSKTKSHTVSPNSATKFSILEGFPHNKVHNCIGGVSHTDPGPYGNMTNFLSPVDPIFFLHHANMDRLWDVWSRKQKANGLPDLPNGSDLLNYVQQRFEFFVDSNGKHVGPKEAGDFLSTNIFHYKYADGFGEKFVKPYKNHTTRSTISTVVAKVQNNIATAAISNDDIKSHLNENSQLIAEIVIPRSNNSSSSREYDVIVNAPDHITQVDADSPYYAGTIAFFGPKMKHMNMSHDTVFQVPLHKKLQAFTQMGQGNTTSFNIRVVPSNTTQHSSVPILKAINIQSVKLP
ncbi:tyrosinase family protein [Marinomonas sp. FW-1]|uniref:tyrosinase family protein n=1 Tax=Marinomonas sp. FW-1 TaxID=2071621 RepID=UPI0010C04048|nr:tyrosinase family protein [Marinomonas sp. FW-1]